MKPHIRCFWQVNLPTQVKPNEKEKQANNGAPRIYKKEKKKNKEKKENRIKEGARTKNNKNGKE
jgi:hypothetical protein